MKFELVIDYKKTEVVIALLKEGRLIELHQEKYDNNGEWSNSGRPNIKLLEILVCRLTSSIERFLCSLLYLSKSPKLFFIILL